MPTFEIDESQLVGLFVEAVLYGFVVVTFPPCIRALIWSNGTRKSSSSIQWPMLLIAIVLAAFATLDMSLTLLHNIKAFILYKGAGGAIEEFTNISDWINIMGTVDVVFPIILGDGVLIYRCWIVYGKNNWVVIIPLLLLLGSFITAIWTIVLEVTLQARATLQFIKLKPIIMTSTLTTLIQNVLTTALIIWRIWRVDRETARYISTMRAAGSLTQQSSGQPRPSTRLQQVIRIVIESGLILTITAIVSTAVYVTNSNSFVIVGNAQVQVIPIAFNLIIIRAKNQTAAEYTYKFTNATLPLAFGGPAATAGSHESQSQSESETDLESGGMRSKKAPPAKHKSNRKGEVPCGWVGSHKIPVGRVGKRGAADGSWFEEKAY
ncbi:hypothetical protein ONZ45_g15815 [Pleurotus djamor]|nr:hypothetical protein ONZ45_g15815 [Pleurotus djamor]